jgi:sporulation-control protein spo0M
MNYNEAVELIKEVADAVNPTGLFLHGRNFDLTLEFNQKFPQIHLLPFTQTTGSDNIFLVTTTMLIAFVDQDGHENTMEQRQEIIAAMDDLAALFEAELRNKKKIQVTSIRREPQYLIYMGVLSGMALNITINSKTSC